MQLEFLDKSPTQSFPSCYIASLTQQPDCPVQPASLQKTQGLPSPPCIYDHTWALSAECLSLTPFSSLTNFTSLEWVINCARTEFLLKKKKKIK